MNATNVWIKNYYYVTPGNGDQLKAAIATGPVGVAINASGYRFSFYSSGIFECAGCGDTDNDLNHAVLLVGYGKEGDKDYFILKNQWGTEWGEQGYMKIVNLGEGNGQSGINLWPIIPVASNMASNILSAVAVFGVTLGLFFA